MLEADPAWLAALALADGQHAGVAVQAQGGDLALAGELQAHDVRVAALAVPEQGDVGDVAFQGIQQGACQCGTYPAMGAVLVAPVHGRIEWDHVLVFIFGVSQQPLRLAMGVHHQRPVSVDGGAGQDLGR
ncbi:hypothetical protein D3C72_1787950 [compost metagenome]